MVSNADYARARPDIVVMAVTSQLRPSLGERDLIVAAWEEAGLLKPSAIKPVLATLEQSLVIRTLGALADGDRDVLRRLLASILG